MREIEIVIDDKGDPSVGLDGGRERVRLTFLDRNDPLDEDVISDLTDFFASWGDGAMTAEQEARMYADERAGDDIMYKEWLADKIYEHAPKDLAEKLIKVTGLGKERG